jgi:hypothetical protein
LSRDITSSRHSIHYFEASGLSKVGWRAGCTNIATAELQYSADTHQQLPIQHGQVLFEIPRKTTRQPITRKPSRRGHHGESRFLTYRSVSWNRPPETRAAWFGLCTAGCTPPENCCIAATCDRAVCTVVEPRAILRNGSIKSGCMRRSSAGSDRHRLCLVTANVAPSPHNPLGFRPPLQIRICRAGWSQRQATRNT